MALKQTREADGWVKIEDDVYELKETRVAPRVRKSVITQEIVDLRADLEANPLLKYPRGANSDMKQAIDDFNHRREQFRYDLEEEILKKEVLLEKLT